MALIKCPECGTQISDKATICPHCGIDVQQALNEMRKEQQRQRKKRKKRTLASIVSILVVAATAGLVYLYCIDALNFIPAEYRQESERYFKECETALNRGKVDDAVFYSDILGYRTLTKRQAKRLKIIRKDAMALALQKTEQQLDNAETHYDETAMDQAKNYMSNIDTLYLNSAQIERLANAKEKYRVIQLKEMQTTAVLYKEKGKEKHFKLFMKIANDLQEFELTPTDRAKVEETIGEVEKAKEQFENNQKKEEAIAFIEKFYSYVLGPNATGWSDEILKRYLDPAVLEFLSETFGEIDTSPLLFCDPAGDLYLVDHTKAVATQDGRYRKDFTTEYWGDSSIKINGSIYYTVNTTQGNMRITKIELVSRDK